jgi:diguanylate cyclase (GGDEF)-like protein
MTWAIDRGTIRVTISCGVAQITPETQDLGALIERADHALPRAKAAGRNRVRVAE